MIKALIDKIFNAKVDAIGLSVFRMFYAAVLLCEILQLIKFRSIIFDAVPYEYSGELNAGAFLSFYFAVVLMLFFGLFTRFTTIVNYIFGAILFGFMFKFEYHVFFAYVGINFLMMFMPVSRVFSLDSLFEKVKYTNIGRPYRPDRKVLEINYLVVVFTAIGLVYFDSVLRKFSSPMWTDGLGVWMPSSLPMVVWNDTSVLLNQEWLVKFLGYLVIVFEFVFIFLFWFKKFRVPFLLLGIFFHLGILVAYPIPWFALTAVVVYLLLVPQSFWLGISGFFKSKNPSYQFYYDAECPLCNKVIVVVKHFDVFNKIECLTVQGHATEQPAFKGIPEMDLLVNIYGVDKKGKIAIGFDAYVALLKHMIYTFPMALLLMVPGISAIGRKIYNYVAGNRLTERCTSENCLMPHFSSPVSETEDFLVAGWNRLNLTKKFWKTMIVVFSIAQLIIVNNFIFPKAVNDSPIGKAFTTVVAHAIKPPFVKFTGITGHPVFMYHVHFEGYNHIFKLVCTENNKVVPLLDNNGMVTNSYANGSMWVNYTYRVSSRGLDKKMYEQGVSRYLRYFEHENHLNSSHYKIYVKAIETTDHWQKDFLHNQMKKPWQEAGTCTLEKNGYSFSWNDKMNAIFAAD